MVCSYDEKLDRMHYCEDTSDSDQYDTEDEDNGYPMTRTRTCEISCSLTSSGGVTGADLSSSGRLVKRMGKYSTFIFRFDVMLIAEGFQV